MGRLQFLLLYRERLLPNEIGGAQSVFDNLNVLTEHEARMVYEYMEGGLPLLDFMGMTVDPLTGKSNVPHFIMTDGKFVWDGILMQWIRLHRVRLPVEFLVHVKKASGLAIDNANLDINELIGELENAVVVRII